MEEFVAKNDRQRVVTDISVMEAFNIGEAIERGREYVLGGHSRLFSLRYVALRLAFTLMWPMFWMFNGLSMMFTGMFSEAARCLVGLCEGQFYTGEIDAKQYRQWVTAVRVMSYSTLITFLAIVTTDISIYALPTMSVISIYTVRVKHFQAEGTALISSSYTLGDVIEVVASLYMAYHTAKSGAIILTGPKLMMDAMYPTVVIRGERKLRYCATCEDDLNFKATFHFYSLLGAVLGYKHSTDVRKLYFAALFATGLIDTVESNVSKFFASFDRRRETPHKRESWLVQWDGLYDAGVYDGSIGSSMGCMGNGWFPVKVSPFNDFADHRHILLKGNAEHNSSGTCEERKGVYHVGVGWVREANDYYIDGIDTYEQLGFQTKAP